MKLDEAFKLTEARKRRERSRGIGEVDELMMQHDEGEITTDELKKALASHNIKFYDTEGGK